MFIVVRIIYLAWFDGCCLVALIIGIVALFINGGLWVVIFVCFVVFVVHSWVCGLQF